MNKEEFEEAFRKHYTPLVSYVRTLVADEEDCHDIVGTAFEGIWKNLQRINPDSVRGYLYSSANHLAINHLRKQQRHRQYIDHYRHIASEAVTDDTLREHDERLSMAMRVVDTLKEPTRTILIRCYIDGKQYKEGAERMGVGIRMREREMGKAVQMLAEFRQKMLKT